MGQGDTTVRIDFETGGASSAKMTVHDVYMAQQREMEATKKKIGDLARQYNMSERDVAKAMRAMNQMQAREASAAARLQNKLDQEAAAAARAAAHQETQATREAERAKRREILETAKERRRIADAARRDALNNARAEARAAKLEQSQKASVDKLLTRGAWGAMMGIAGYAGVAGISGIIQTLSSEISNFISKRGDLEKAITPLSSIGDNVKNLSAVRKEVVALSASTGLSTDNVAEFLNDLESSTGNLDPKTVRDLKNEIVELTKVKGGNIAEMGEMMVSAWQIAGKEMKNVNELQNKIAYTEEIGKAKIGQLAQFLPTALNIGDLLGISMNEILGTIAGGSLKTGNVEKLMTGYRNFMLIMEQAPSKGIKLTGSYTQKLEQLNELFKTNRDGMIKLFDREVVDAAYQIVSQVDVVKEKISDLQNMPSTGDIVADKLKTRLDDMTSQAAAIDKIYKTLIDQAPNLTSEGDMGSLAYQINERANMAFLGGKKISGGSTVGGYAAAFYSLLGLNKFVDIGNKTAIDFTPPGPERDLLLRQQFELGKSRDLSKLYGTNEMAWSKWGGMLGYDWDSERIKSIKNRPFNLEEARAQNPYSTQIGTAMASKEAQDLVDALNKNTQATLDSMSASKASAKPGGAKTNYEE